MSETAPVNSKQINVSPSSVRVWRGYRATQVSSEKFRDRLGDVFIPGTVQIMGEMGLTAYLPSVLPESSFDIPNEIAIVFYQSKETYYNTFDTTAGRLYGLLHQSIFSKSRSKSGFPQLFNDSVEFDQPYFLLDQEADWYHGDTQVYVGTKDPSQDSDSYKKAVTNTLKTIQKSSDEHCDGIIACVNDEYLIYWEHWQDHNSMNKIAVDELTKVTQAVYNKVSTNKVVSENFTARYEGISIEGDDCLNVLFERL